MGILWLVANLSVFRLLLRAALILRGGLSITQATCSRNYLGA